MQPPLLQFVLIILEGDYLCQHILSGNTMIPHFAICSSNGTLPRQSISLADNDISLASVAWRVCRHEGASIPPPTPLPPIKFHKRHHKENFWLHHYLHWTPKNASNPTIVKFNCIPSPLPIDRVRIAPHAAASLLFGSLDRSCKRSLAAALRFFFLCVIVVIGNNPRHLCNQRLGLTVEYLSSCRKVIVSNIIVVSDLTAVTSFSCDATDTTAARGHAIQAPQGRGAIVDATFKR